MLRQVTYTVQFYREMENQVINVVDCSKVFVSHVVYFGALYSAWHRLVCFLHDGMYALGVAHSALRIGTCLYERGRLRSL